MITASLLRRRSRMQLLAITRLILHILDFSMRQATVGRQALNTTKLIFWLRKRLLMTN